VDGVKRGDVVTVALQGDHGKPRPALVIQSDLVADHPSIVVLPLTSTLTSAPPVPDCGGARCRDGIASPQSGDGRPADRRAA